MPAGYGAISGESRACGGWSDTGCKRVVLYPWYGGAHVFGTHASLATVGPTWAYLRGQALVMRVVLVFVSAEHALLPMLSIRDASCSYSCNRHLCFISLTRPVLLISPSCFLFVVHHSRCPPRRGGPVSRTQDASAGGSLHRWRGSSYDIHPVSFSSTCFLFPRCTPPYIYVYILVSRLGIHD